MAAPVSPRLLSSYLAAAARQVLEGEALSERSRWAIAHAKRQLQSDLQVLTGERAVPEGMMPAAVRHTGGHSRPGLAAITLASLPSSEEPLTRSVQERRVAAHLDEVLTDLEALLAEHAERGDSARRIATTFAPPHNAAA